MLSHLNIQLKILLGFTSILLLLLLSTVISNEFVADVNEDIRFLNEVSNQLVSEAGETAALLLKASSELEKYNRENNKDVVVQIGERRDELIKKLTEILVKIDQTKKHVKNDKLNEQLAEAQKNLERYEGFSSQIMFKHRVLLETRFLSQIQKLTAEKDELMAQVRMHEEATSKNLQQIAVIAHEINRSAIKKAMDTTATVSRTMIIGTIVSIVLGIILAIFIGRDLSGPINEFSRFMDKIGLDMSQRLRVQQKNEIGKLATQFNEFLSNLENNLKQVFVSSESTLKYSNAMTGNVENFVSQTQAQLNELKQVEGMLDHLANDTQGVVASLRDAEKLEEVNGSQSKVRQTIQNMDAILLETYKTIRETRSSLTSVSVVAQDTLRETEAWDRSVADSEKIIADMIGLTQKVEANAQQMEETIRTMKDISDLVHVLALNASLEGAKAGEYGKGFLNVADQLQTVSKRVDSLSAEINNLIHDDRQRADQVRSFGQRLAEGFKTSKTQSRTAHEHIVKLSESSKNYTNQLDRLSETSSAMTNLIASVEEWTDAHEQHITNLKNQLAQISQRAFGENAKMERTADSLRTAIKISKDTLVSAAGNKDSITQLSLSTKQLSKLLENFKVGKSRY
ncbi:methyl-accepting chemotaxis protein [bacterium]|nr:methyl-accepting chemotaxis protein [bacterium]